MPDETLEWQVMIAQLNARPLTKVPRGLEIETRKITFAVQNPMAGFDFPSDQARTNYVLKPPYRDVAQCRVKDEFGPWWLALRSIDQTLSYIHESDTSIVGRAR